MPATEPTVLLVDDDEKILFAFQEVLRADGCATAVARNGEEALALLDTVHPHAVFMDITMPRMNGLEALQRMKQTHPALPVVLITGFGTMQTAVRAMQLGAFDYLTKPLDVATVRSVARRALAAARPAAAAEEGASGTAELQDPYAIVGDSAAMQEVYKLIGSICTTPNHTSVLVLGESGTGKELVARAIHAHGLGAAEPFIAINCTALPAELLESELFGHERGAFTGAVERKLGKFEIARAGTLFLDEVGNLSTALQQKLLRVLQEREFERVGGNTPIPVHARFIAATNADLGAEVRRKAFREDLYFRLNVVRVQLPALRERRDDVPKLVSHFLARYNVRLGKAVLEFSDEAMRLLLAYPFPGNVRELENLVERAVMLTNGAVVQADALPDLAPTPTIARVHTATVDSFSAERERVVEEFERRYVTDLLRLHHGNVSAAAQEADMTRQNLQRLMRKYGIDSSAYRG